MKGGYPLFAFALRGEMLRFIDFHSEGGGENQTQHTPRFTKIFAKHVEEAKVPKEKETTFLGVVSIQPYIRQNAKIILEYKANFSDMNESKFFIGVHFAF